MGADFKNITFNEALELAKQENKFLMFMIEEEYCPWCKKIKAVTLKDKNVNEILDDKYISLKLYKNAKYPKKFHTRMVPTIFLINPQNNKILKKIIGYIGPASFEDKLFIESHFTN